MSEKPRISTREGYQAQKSTPAGKPPKGGSNVNPPSSTTNKTG